MSLAVSLAFRSLSSVDSAALANPATPVAYYTTIDAAYNHLSGLEKLISSLPPLPDPNATARRNFDLINLVHLYRRHFLRLDLLIHQRIIESFLSPANPALPQPSLAAYETSSLRVQRCFAIVASMAQHATNTACFGSARRLVETLEVCTSWTSLRNADPITAIELIKELGITLETGQTLLQLLCMSGWSLASSSELHKGLSGGLRLMYHVVPPSPHRAPPTVPELERAREEERRLHPERFKNPMHFLSILKGYQKGKEKVEEPAYTIGRWENGQFIEDWSFLDEFMPPEGAPSIWLAAIRR
ncbi:uncharacterized protein JCM10292_007514 [Rhodotorula paludigena]|uniref:uncharacterized protein n=1 Tax=Rhodotorula paludigena TaxID=86838 RepID=UPI0031746928